VLPMPLDPLAHLIALAASQVPVSHTWSAGESMTALGRETPALIKNVGELSFRTVLGLQAALGEWMTQRFRHLYNDQEHDQLNEAVWAASIDFRYLRMDTMKFADQPDPVRGPLGLSKGLSRDICKMYQRAQFGAVRYVISSANLVRYVLPDTKTFQVWFRTVVQRLPSLSAPSARVAGAFDIKVRRQPPMGVSEAVFGTPVPREAFDPSFDLSASSPTALIDAMLVRIAGRSNPFLWTTAELNAAGVPGTPYRYPP
jgi:hypothetical protein